MKRFGIGIYVLLVLFTAFALYLASCGHSNSSSNSTTTVSTDTQAAQAAVASVKTARNVMVIGSALAMISAAITNSGGLPLAPAAGSQPGMAVSTAALDRFSSGFAPVLQKTIGLRAAAVSLPATIDCATNTTITGGSATTPDSVTIVGSGIGPFTATFNTCRQGTAQVDGIMTATLTGIIAANLTLGTSAAPLVVTEYAGASSSSIVDVLKTASNISFSRSGATDTFTATGSFENWDYVAHAHQTQALNSLAMAVTTGTAVVGNANYSVDTLKVNGLSTATVSVSDTDMTVSYTEANSFTNFEIVEKTPAPGSPDFDYLTMTGTFSLSTAPADRCVEGTFSIATNTDVQIDNTSGTAVAGQITINAMSVATFNADGSMTVVVNGGAPATYTETELAGLCPL